MIIVFDLDRTLIHSSQFEEDVVHFFFLHGVPKRDWWEEFGRSIDVKRLYSPWKQFLYFRRKGLMSGDLKTFKREFYRYFHDQKKYKHEFLDPLLSRLKKNNKLILLTFGTPWWQAYRVNRIGVQKYFDEMFFTTESKDSVLEKIAKKHKNEKILFIDDSKKFITRTKLRIPEIFIVQALFQCCGNTTVTPFADAPVKSLVQLSKLLSKDKTNLVARVDIKKFGNDNASMLAQNLLRRNKIISVPTETSYGLAADATSLKAVKQIYNIKDRDEAKRIPCMVRDREQLKKYVKLSATQENWIKKYENKTVSFRVKKKAGKLTALGSDSTVVTRKANHPFLKALAKNFNKPFTITSTNISGKPSIFSFQEYQKQFKNQTHQVDAFFDYGKLKAEPASTIVDVTQNPPQILRQGKTKINVKTHLPSKSHRSPS